MEIRERKKRELIDILVCMGFTAELGEAIAANLRTEKPMNRMIGYLLSAQPRTEEDIVDEMLAIMSDRDTWIRKKETEFYNQKYNEYLNSYREED